MLAYKLWLLNTLRLMTLPYTLWLLTVVCSLLVCWGWSTVLYRPCWGGLYYHWHGKYCRIHPSIYMYVKPILNRIYEGFCHILQMLFMSVLSANYTRINISKELTDYRNAVDMEEIDLHSNGRGILDNSYERGSFKWSTSLKCQEIYHSYKNWGNSYLWNLHSLKWRVRIPWKINPLCSSCNI